MKKIFLFLFAIVCATVNAQFLPISPTYTAGYGWINYTDWNTFNGKVPYTGATTDVDLSTHSLNANNISLSTATVTASGGTTTLTVNSSRFQILNGLSNQTYQLPDATTLRFGTTYEFNNNTSSNTLSVTDNGGNAICSIPYGGYARITCIYNGNTNGTWDPHYLIPKTSSWGTSGATVAGTFSASTSVTTPTVSITGGSSSNVLSGSGTQLNTAGTGSVELSGYRTSYQPMYSGYWRTSPYVGAPTSTTLFANYMFWMPYMIERSHSVTDITIEITTAATGSLSISLYTDSAGRPQKLIEQSGNLATTGTVTTGNKTYTFTGGSGTGGAQVLTGDMKVVWMGVWCSSSSVATRIYVTAQQIQNFYLTGTGSIGGYVAYRNFGSYTGTWPTYAGTLTGQGAQSAYLMSLKVQ